LLPPLVVFGTSGEIGTVLLGGGGGGAGKAGICVHLPLYATAAGTGGGIYIYLI